MWLADIHPGLDEWLAQTEVGIRLVWEGEAHFLGTAARRALSGRGKRLRPTILLLAAECASGATKTSAALASVAEVVHAASLVHDDVMDGASSRRGRESANAAWGNKVSVLLGDYLLARALNLLPAGERERFLPELSEAARRMCVGQVEELRASGRRLGEEEYVRIARLKTGSLFGFCGKAGAETGGGGEGLAEVLGRFGEAFGIAFQLADDILDFVGCGGRSGKPEGRDLAERKCTLPLILAAQRGSGEALQRLEQMLAGDGPSGGDMLAAREWAASTGAIESAWERVEERLAAAQKHLADVPDCTGKDTLAAACGDRFPLPVMATAE